MKLRAWLVAAQRNGVPISAIIFAAMLSATAAIRPALASQTWNAVTALVSCASTGACQTYLNNGAGTGVAGIGGKGPGVSGKSITGAGLSGSSVSGFGAVGSSSSNTGVLGISKTQTGVYGASTSADGVVGASQTVNGVSGRSSTRNGVVGYTKSDVYGTYGVEGTSGSATYSTSGGVHGVATAGIGVEGTATQGDGVSGVTDSDLGGVAVRGYNFAPGSPAPPGNDVGVFGASQVGSGIYAYSSSGNAADIENDNPDSPTLFVQTDTGGNNPILVYNQKTGAFPFRLDAGGNIYATGHLIDAGGTYSRTQNPHSDTLTYSAKQTESTVEDFGSARLIGGSATVTLEVDFKQTIDARGSYMVFLTPYGDNRGLYIASRTPDGFTVREAQGGRSNLAFDYRVLAPAFGERGARLPHMATLAANMPRLPMRGDVADAKRRAMLMNILREHKGHLSSPDKVLR